MGVLIQDFSEFFTTVELRTVTTGRNSIGEVITTEGAGTNISAVVIKPSGQQLRNIEQLNNGNLAYKQVDLLLLCETSISITEEDVIVQDGKRYRAVFVREVPDPETGTADHKKVILSYIS